MGRRTRPGQFPHQRNACEAKRAAGKYKDQWEGSSPEVRKNKLLWLLGEIGEVIDIVKKHGGQAACAGSAKRDHLIEGLADGRMDYNAVLLCDGITADEREYYSPMKIMSTE